MMEGEEVKNIASVCLTVISSLCYCYFISSKLPKGIPRLLSLAPIFFVFSILPLYLNSAFFTAVAAFLFTWLANFRLVLFAFDHSSVPSNSLPIFMAATALPFKIIPSRSIDPPPKKPKKLPLLHLATEIPISALLISSLDRYGEKLHPYIRLSTYCCLVFLLIEVLVESSSLLVRTTLGLEIEPASNEPYLSTSLREFWGKRWNVTVGGLLRETVHRPLKSYTESYLGRETAALIGVLASFLVSGLMHELLFWYVNRTGPSWEMTSFFVFHGVCVAAELVVGRALSGLKVCVPWYLSGPMTVGFVVATSFWLFFPPVTRDRADLKVIEEFRYAGKIVEDEVAMVESWIVRIF